MGGHHGKPAPGHQDAQAANVRLVDLVAVAEGDGLRLVVRALAEPDARARAGQVTAVALGSPEVGLDDRTGRREVLAQLGQDCQRRVGGGVVLHVEGHRGAGVRRRLTDGAGVREGDPLAVAGQRLTDRRELDRHLGVLGETFVRKGLQQLDVGVPGGVRLLLVEGVLAEVVEGDLQPVVDQDLVTRTASSVVDPAT